MNDCCTLLLYNEQKPGAAIGTRLHYMHHLVGLLRAYLNRGDLLHDLRELARQLDKALERGEAPATRSVSTVVPSFRQRRLADRLDEAQVQAIVSAFEAGTPRWQLAEQYGISVRSVGRLLRKRRAEQDEVA